MASLMTVVHRAAASSVSAASRSVGAPCFLIAKLCNLSSGVCSTSYFISITAPTGCESCEKQRIGESFHWDEISLGKQSSRRFSGFARRNVLNEFTSRMNDFSFPNFWNCSAEDEVGVQRGWYPRTEKITRGNGHVTTFISFEKFIYVNLKIYAYIYICRNWGKKEFC